MWDLRKLANEFYKKKENQVTFSKGGGLNYGTYNPKASKRKKSSPPKGGYVFNPKVKIKSPKK